ncbi:polyadenylate-binding protein-interacting protein 5 [Ricinus communis]|uniref:CUE domain-containing protein n=1 Tax=Ricinus communis TaxID=3988 RepID=B9RS89_RICCO|nr:polyadenylate-binding protein-interacting protein 5 [Ricinus communis]EEF45949.1 conserved hypothetical protein [Ricinus communis]|eukprot:XP_002516608.1 polyadenylate-binding protein-interacting protein 5 [Ricinus communis]
MKPGVSRLNPYAASYVPLSKREAAGKTEVPGLTTKSSHAGDQTIWFGPAEHTTQKKQHEKTSDYDLSVLKSHTFHVAYGSSSQNPDDLTEKQTVNEDYDILEFLQASFPGVSDESLNDVYKANKCDLEATIDMLNHLEFDTFEYSENLPDTLDIGDVSELGSLAECASVKLKNVAGEASASSSGTPASNSVVLT